MGDAKVRAPVSSQASLAATRRPLPPALTPSGKENHASNDGFRHTKPIATIPASQFHGLEGLDLSAAWQKVQSSTTPLRTRSPNTPYQPPSVSRNLSRELIDPQPRSQLSRSSGMSDTPHFNERLPQTSDTTISNVSTVRPRREHEKDMETPTMDKVLKELSELSMEPSSRVRKKAPIVDISRSYLLKKYQVLQDKLEMVTAERDELAESVEDLQGQVSRFPQYLEHTQSKCEEEQRTWEQTVNDLKDRLKHQTAMANVGEKKVALLSRELKQKTSELVALEKAMEPAEAQSRLLFQESTQRNQELATVISERNELTELLAKAMEELKNVQTEFEESKEDFKHTFKVNRGMEDEIGLLKASLHEEELIRKTMENELAAAKAKSEAHSTKAWILSTFLDDQLDHHRTGKDSGAAAFSTLPQVRGADKSASPLSPASPRSHASPSPSSPLSPALAGPSEQQEMAWLYHDTDLSMMEREAYLETHDEDQMSVSTIRSAVATGIELEEMSSRQKQLQQELENVKAALQTAERERNKYKNDVKELLECDKLAEEQRRETNSKAEEVDHMRQQMDEIVSERNKAVELLQEGLVHMRRRSERKAAVRSGDGGGSSLTIGQLSTLEEVAQKALESASDQSTSFFVSNPIARAELDIRAQQQKVEEELHEARNAHQEMLSALQRLKVIAIGRKDLTSQQDELETLVENTQKLKKRMKSLDGLLKLAKARGDQEEVMRICREIRAIEIAYGGDSSDPLGNILRNLDHVVEQDPVQAVLEAENLVHQIKKTFARLVPLSDISLIVHGSGELKEDNVVEHLNMMLRDLSAELSDDKGKELSQRKSSEIVDKLAGLRDQLTLFKYRKGETSLKKIVELQENYEAVQQELNQTQERLVNAENRANAAEVQRDQMRSRCETLEGRVHDLISIITDFKKQSYKADGVTSVAAREGTGEVSTVAAWEGANVERDFVTRAVTELREMSLPRHLDSRHTTWTAVQFTQMARDTHSLAELESRARGTATGRAEGLSAVVALIQRFVKGWAARRRYRALNQLKQELNRAIEETGDLGDMMMEMMRKVSNRENAASSPDTGLLLKVKQMQVDHSHVVGRLEGIMRSTVSAEGRFGFSITKAKQSEPEVSLLPVPIPVAPINIPDAPPADVSTQKVAGQSPASPQTPMAPTATPTPAHVASRVSDDTTAARVKGKLKCKAVRATNLPKADTFGKSDPYVVLTVGKAVHKTKYLKNTLNPEWNEEFEVNVDTAEEEELKIDVYDWDRVGNNTALCHTSFPLSILPPGSKEEKTLKLTLDQKREKKGKPSSGGEITCEFTFEPEMAPQPAPS